MKINFKNLIGCAAVILLVVFNIQFINTDNTGMLSLNNLITQAKAVAEQEPPQSWASEYKECEWEIQIGIPPLVVTKKVQGSYRACVPGGGVCLWGDAVCCTRVAGICVF